ncbi:MAG TPA: ATP-binding protein [Candidatus Cybelea sp.]|nr:ATP-binding protein [Candidatus Cybelea sp.]
MSEGMDTIMASLRPANDAAPSPEAGAGTPGNVAELMSLVGATLLDAMFGNLAPSYLAGISGEVLYANAAYQRLAAESGQTLLPSHRRAVQRALDRREPFMLHETLGRDDKARIYTSRHFPIFGPDGRVAAVGASFNDATGESEARASARLERQRLNDVIRSTSDWVWETDDRGRIAFVSERITEALGIPPQLLHGRFLADVGQFLPTGARPGTSANVLQLFRPFRDVPFEIEDRRGGSRRFHLSGVPVYDDAGRYFGFRGTATDVTERHAAEDRARQSRRELEGVLEELTAKNLQLDVALRRATAATNAKREFLATMSHELRTPLNAIIGFSEMMQLGTLGPLPRPYQGYVNDMLTAGRHLLALINDILDVARIEGEAMRIEIESVPLSQLIADARAIMETRAADKHIDIAAVGYDGDLVIDADKTRALQVIINLLGNAVKFTQSGGRVGIDVGSRDARFATVTVWDNGPGIPPDKREVIFEKFQQVHETILSRREAGIGLGLTLSRQLARLMGGDLTLDHSDGQGSRFTATFPLALQPKL